jgi:hypothetical protein
MYVLYDSHNKQRLFPLIKRINRFVLVMGKQGVLCEVGTEFINIYSKFLFKVLVAVYI